MELMTALIFCIVYVSLCFENKKLKDKNKKLAEENEYLKSKIYYDISDI